MAPATPPAATGKGLSKKIGPLPTWAWLGLGAVVVGGVWYVRRKDAAAATAVAPAAGSAGSTAGAGAASTPYGPAGGGGVGSDTLAAILASQGAGSSGSSSTSWTPPVGEVLQGSSYLPPGAQVGANSSAPPVTDAQGHTYEWLTSGAQVLQLQKAGQTIYIQPVPGVFMPAPNQTSPAGAAYVRTS